MSDHLSAQTLGRHARRELSAAALLRVDEHLSSCETCRETLVEQGRVRDTLVALHSNLVTDHHAAASEHPTYEQLAALADDSLGVADREIVEGHLDLCQPCRAEIDDLRAFRSSLRGQPLAPAASPADGVLDFARAAAMSRRRDGFPRLSGFSVAVQIAALVLLAISLTAWFQWSRSARSAEGIQTQTPRAPSTQPGTSNPPPAPSDTAPAIVVALVDEGGRRVTLDTRGEVKGLERLTGEARDAIKVAMTTGRLETPGDLAGLSGRTGTLMSGPGAGGTFSLSSPRGTAVRSDRPTFRWRPLPGASRYTVTVIDPNRKVVVATSPPVSATTWMPPTALDRGRVYLWQVSALKDGQEIVSPTPPAPEARFKVLDRATDDDLARVEETAADSHLARAVLYARAGLLDDAERELRALAAANPDAPIAQSLLQNLRRP